MENPLDKLANLKAVPSHLSNEEKRKYIKLHKTIQKLESLTAKDEQGGFIYRGFEAHLTADKLLLQAVDELGAKELADAYRKVRKTMCFEYGQ